MATSPEFPGIRTLTESEMFALDLNATALAEESSSLACVNVAVMDPAALLAEATTDLEWLASHAALTGIAAIIRERRAQVERGDSLPSFCAAQSALDLGELVEAGALIAAELDSEAEPPP